MRALLLSSYLLFVVAAHAQQAADVKNLGLVGDRFAPLTWDQMTPEQKTMTEHVLAGQRRSMGGPFNILLRSPEMGDLAQQFGASMRFLTSMPVKLRELAIIITSRYWTAQFEWQAHSAAARQAGLSDAVINAIAEGRRPQSLQPDEVVVYNFATELLNTKQVSDPNFIAAKNLLGERGVVDLIGLMGYYQMVAMMLNVDRYPLGDGVAPPLKPLPAR
jgi:4-carboxymuconolactone decarboxylase